MSKSLVANIKHSKTTEFLKVSEWILFSRPVCVCYEGFIDALFEITSQFNQRRSGMLLNFFTQVSQ
jgi:hypothetical protein